MVNPVFSEYIVEESGDDYTSSCEKSWSRISLHFRNLSRKKFGIVVEILEND